MKLVFTRAAEEDLSNIWDYTVETWGSNQAKRYTLGIKIACAELCDGGQPSQSAEHIRPGFRKVIVGRHVLYFVPHDDRIEIIRILHQSMDVDSHL